MSRNSKRQSTKETPVSENTQNTQEAAAAENTQAEQAAEQVVQDQAAPQPEATEQAAQESAPAPQQEAAEKPAEAPAAESAKLRGATPEVAQVDDPVFIEDPVYRKHIFGPYEASREPTEVEKKLVAAINADNKTLANIATILAEYRRDNGSHIASDKQRASEQTGKLWVAMRQSIGDKVNMRDGLDLILLVFRENRSNAFALNMLLRYIGAPGSYVQGQAAHSFTVLAATFRRAAELTKKGDISRTVNLNDLKKDTVFTEEQAKKLIGYFSSL